MAKAMCCACCFAASNSLSNALDSRVLSVTRLDCLSIVLTAGLEMTGIDRVLVRTTADTLREAVWLRRRDTDTIVNLTVRGMGRVSRGSIGDGVSVMDIQG